MAQARQEVEVYQNAMISCLEEFGVRGIATIGGTVGTGGLVDDDGLQPAGAEELRSKAFDECHDRVPAPHLWDAPLDRNSYDRVIESRDCLIAHGIEVREAPTFEVWRDQSVPWSPHEVLYDLVGQLSDEELHALVSACPQPGGGAALHRVIPEDAW